MPDRRTTLCDRLIGGAVDGLMLAIDTITSFWQTPREVEWTKAAADGLAEREAEEEVAEPKSHWKVGDSYCGLCGENITAVSFHACPMRTKVAEPKCGPNGPQCDDKWCMYCVPMVAPKTPAVTPRTAANGPAEGAAPRPPSAVVDMCCCDFGGVIVTQICVPCRCNDHGGCDHPTVNPPTPEFDWVTTAIPVIAGVLAEHVPSPQCNYILCLNGQLETCGEFRDWQGWRAHVAPHIAVDIQSDCLTTTYDFPSGDRPRPLADFPKHQK